jgi:hypothetical protein
VAKHSKASTAIQRSAITRKPRDTNISIGNQSTERGNSRMGRKNIGLQIREASQKQQDQQTKEVKPSRRTFSGAYNVNASPTVKALASLSPWLPDGWENFFNARHVGRNWGLMVICPVCNETAPGGYQYTYRKWRWLTVHLATEHSTRRGAQPRKAGAA